MSRLQLEKRHFSPTALVIYRGLAIKPLSFPVFGWGLKGRQFFGTAGIERYPTSRVSALVKHLLAAFF